MIKTAGMVAWFVCLAPFLLSPVGARAAEVGDGPIASPESGWPQWRGPRRDGISREKGLLPSWPEGGPRLLWKSDGLGSGWSSPIIVSNRLYIPGDLKGELVIHAFDLDGKPVWQGKNGQAWSGAYPGARVNDQLPMPNVQRMTNV
jgi:hypothetical protein